MKQYLRFGKIPPKEKSIDFIKLSFDANDDFTFDLQMGEIEKAYSNIPENCYEDGVSVFELDENNKPVLSNENLKKDYETRIKDKETAYTVIGNQVGFGRDGEPLLKNITIIKKY